MPLSRKEEPGPRGMTSPSAPSPAYSRGRRGVTAFPFPRPGGADWAARPEVARGIKRKRGAGAASLAQAAGEDGECAARRCQSASIRRGPCSARRCLPVPRTLGTGWPGSLKAGGLPPGLSPLPAGSPAGRAWGRERLRLPLLSRPTA